jgi:hypothetical protein
VALGQKLIGEDMGLPRGAQRGPTRAWALTKWAAGAAALGATIEAMNRYLFPEENEKLKKEMGGRLYVITGREDPKTGRIPYYTNRDSFRDWLGWFGADAWLEHQDDYHAGRITFGEVLTEKTAKNWLNRAYQQLRPELKFYDLAGYKTFPSVFSRRPAPDPKEQLFDQFTLGWYYRRYHQLPEKPGQWRKILTGQSTADPQESSYWNAGSDARNWLRRQDKEPPPVMRGNDRMRVALYWNETALRLGDLDSADYFLWQYASAGGNDKSPDASLAAMDPLAVQKESQVNRYLEQLTPEEAMRLRRAYYHWQTLVAPEAPVEGLEKSELREFILQIRAIVKEAINAQFPITTLQTMMPELQRFRDLPLDERDRRLGAMSKADKERLRNLYLQFQERVAPDAEGWKLKAVPMERFVPMMETLIQDEHARLLQEKALEKAGAQ